MLRACVFACLLLGAAAFQPSLMRSSKLLSRPRTVSPLSEETAPSTSLSGALDELPTESLALYDDQFKGLFALDFTIAATMWTFMLLVMFLYQTAMMPANRIQRDQQFLKTFVSGPRNLMLSRFLAGFNTPIEGWNLGGYHGSLRYMDVYAQKYRQTMKDKVEVVSEGFEETLGGGYTDTKLLAEIAYKSRVLKGE
mmetsp:Transcript_38033/g.74749  ORF Transcript_38033/g.74749 Transcript_38033/m.74749 type:complete len:196 (+) Transcript_38033:111-698(+)